MIISDEAAQVIRDLVAEGRTQKSIADELGVHFTTINKIIRNRSHKIPENKITIAELEQKFIHLEQKIDKEIKTLQRDLRLSEQNNDEEIDKLKRKINDLID